MGERRRECLTRACGCRMELDVRKEETVLRRAEEEDSVEEHEILTRRKERFEEDAEQSILFTLLQSPTFREEHSGVHTDFASIVLVSVSSALPDGGEERDRGC